MRLLRRLRSSAPEPTFSNVLTPGRIPEFCIPRRMPLPCVPESPLPAALPRRCAAEPDLWPSRAAYDRGEDRTDWDPRSQAALSLPHLPRARTTYGFCALLESPHLGRAGDGLRLAAEYCPRRARLHIRLLRVEGPAAALEPRAVGCRLTLLLRSSGQQRAAVLGRSRKAAFGQDFSFDGLAEEQLRRLAVRVKAESKGSGLERGRPLGQGEVLLGSLLPL
ncbi:C2 calcium-dependent domain-containing protein 4A-like [Nannospalax galili]|uniref:C2 calcium-dependent domain-containing protein 4A-like n=1 Tax=Nannospalax galili TaxID=1026970 RepID=A0A8C6R513_NANGA|nr:C2 calcium-dependent domain-containing protein 4A-like [Nannospalax galili]